MRPSVSVIIVFHDGLGYLKACLDSVLSSAQEDDEIIVVANNDDESKLNLPDFGPRIRLLKFTQSLGYAGASNAGAAIASRKYFIFCDHDLVFYEHWIEHLWESYSSVPNIGACSCKAINPHSMTILDFGIAFSQFNGAHPGLDLPQAHPLVSRDRIAQAVCTSGLLISANDFFASGQFDNRFGSMYTDLDICLQLKRLNRVVVASARALALHFGGDIHMTGEKSYKAGHLKADIKGAFMHKHADILTIDLGQYFSEAIDYHIAHHGPLCRYLSCNLMNVADPDWYEEQLAFFGMQRYESLRVPSRHRDAANIGLFELLGFDVMRSNVRIAYFVDRAWSIRGNEYWWSQRRGKGDIVVDRNANILSVEEALLW